MKKGIKSSVIAILMMVVLIFSSTVAVLANSGELRIIIQPTDGYANVGKVASTKVVAGGEGLTYTWFVKDVNSDTFVKSSIKTNEYMVTMTAEKSGRQAYCVVSDINGDSVTTNTVVLSTPPEIKITKQPESVEMSLGGFVQTSVEAEGIGLSYQWFVKDATDDTFKKSSIAVKTYIYMMTAEKSGRQAYCVITDKYGNSKKTDVVAFTMAEIKITKQPENKFVPLGNLVQTSVEAEGIGLRYQWFVKDTTDEAFKKSSITGNSYIYTMTKEKSGRQAYCVITDIYGNKKTTDTVAFYLSNLSIIEQPQNVGVPAGKSATVRVKATGEELQYMWFIKDPGEEEFVASEIVSDEYTVLMSEEISGRQAYCEITDKVGHSICSKTVELAVSDGVVITKQPVGTHVLIGETIMTSVEATGVDLTYTWYVKDPGESQYKKSAIKTNTYIFQMTEEKNGRQVYCVITDKYGNKATSDIALLRKTTLKIVKQPYHTSGTVGKTIITTIKAEGEGLTYTWYVKSPGGTAFTKSAIKANSYSFTLSEANSGRQVYCVITDKYGDSIESTIAVMGTNAGLKLLEDLTDAKAPVGTNLTVGVVAEGTELSYQWYVKSRTDAEFSKSSNALSSYTYRTDGKIANREVYCVITDSSGNSVKTKTAKLSFLAALKINEQPTDIGGTLGAKVSTSVKAEGAGLKYRWYTKAKGEAEFTPSSVTSSTYTTTVSEAAKGSQAYCVITDIFGVTKKTDTITVGEYKYYITADLGAGKIRKIGVAPNGSYTLKTPIRVGFNFKGWVDDKGNTFSGTQSVSDNIKISAVWEIQGTDTLAELIDLTSKGADTIKITGNITVDKPIYISYNTKIYADGNYTIKRSPSYNGDIFVVGRDYDEISAIMKHRKATLTLGGGKGTLTIDGNRDNLKVTVVGSAVFVGDSATLNLYDGVVIKNNKKLGNERVFIYTAYCSVGSVDKVGGAAVVNMDSTVNIYGGIIENNEVAMEYTQITTEEGTIQSKESNGCGGAIFNRGTMTIYGGTIRENNSLRGGAIYNDRIIYLRAGTIEGNNTVSYGGAISSSSSGNVDLFIGSEQGDDEVIIRNNTSARAGGSLYSSVQSPIMIYGNTLFEGNYTDTSSGGAIYTAGTLVISDATFRGNRTTYSGGSIYFHYSNLNYTARQLIIDNCVFEENEGSLGGAIVVSAGIEATEQKLGAKATITNTIFKNNVSVKNHGNIGNGGAIYATRCADMSITDCTFEGNQAATSGGGISIHSGAKVKIINTNYTGNQATSGAAVNISTGVTVTLDNIEFNQNKAVLNANGGGGHGGAIYMLVTEPEMHNLTFKNNTAENNGGAIYQNASDLTIGSDISFEGNTALGHGGAVYMTYQRLADNVLDGSTLTADNVLFKDNTASAGGAVSTRSECKVIFNDAQLINNTATGVENNASGGGAVYVGYGEATFNNVTAMGNSSAGYGGVVSSVSSPVTVNGGNFEANFAPAGGVINAIIDSNVGISNATIKDNESTYDNVDYNANKAGGAVNISSGILTISNTVLDGNKSDYYGGTIAANNTLVYINDNTVIKNSSGGTGAALYFRGRTAATLEDIQITNNTSTYNGVIYAGNGILTVKRVVASGNKGVNGGVFFTSGSSYVEVVNSSFTSNSATQGGVLHQTGSSVVTLRSNTMTSNSAEYGGAIYNIANALDLNANIFTANTATSNGGAIYNYGGNITATENNAFASNSATGHGGAVYITYITDEEGVRHGGVLNMQDGAFTENTALAGGAVSIRTACEATFNGTVFTGNSVEGYQNKNDGDGEGGGVVYVGYGTVTLNNVTATGNTAGLGGVVDSINGTVNITGGTYNDNSADNGGVIYAYSNSKINLTGGLFENNSANSGGVIKAVSNSEVTVVDAEFKTNKSTEENTAYDTNVGGGAINISGGKLTVTGATLDGNSTGYYGGTILANGTNVIVNGETVVKNSAGGTGAALYFKGATVQVENTTIQNNTATSNGVVYSSSGTLTFVNVTASGNKSNNGGVFYLSGGTNTVTGGTFTGNTATNNGGVLFLSGGAKLTATDSTFSGNKAANGGAVYTVGNAKAELNNCTFDANTGKGGSLYVTENANVTLNGGKVENHSTNNAIWTDSGTTTINDLLAENNSASVIQARDTAVVNVNNSEFTNNTASNGSVIYAHGSTVNLAGNTFKENSVTGNGGAVYINGATVNATGDNLFENNSATGHGGAVYITYFTDEEGVRHGGVLNMQDGTFTENTALAGGAVSIRTACEATFNGTVFTGNSVEGYQDKNDGDGEGGGVIYVGYGTVNLNNVTATGNTAGLGGVIDSASGTVNITGGTYSENTASSGGAIYAIVKSTITINDAEFKNNESTDTTVEGKIGGGAININTGSLTATNTVFDGNKTAYYGGAINAQNATVAINGNSVVKNSTGATGAALYFRDGSKVTIENSSIESNTSTSNGVVYTNGGTLSLTNVTATGNKSYNGALLYASGGTNTVTGGTFTGNTATNNGGVLFLSGGAKLTATDSTFSGNKAANGGAVYAMGNAKADLNNCTFDANTGKGGSVHVTETANVTLNGGIIENHTSTNAIWTNSGTTNLNGVTAKNNTNGSGSVIYAETTAVVNVADSEFTNNSATHGAVIYAKAGEINLTGNTFKENTVTGNGGAVYINGATVDGTGENLFENNSATGHGGAIYVSYFTDEEGVRHYGVLNMQDGTFIGNTALAGGAVSVRTGCEATFNGTVFTDNSVEGYTDTNDGDGEGGGVIYVGYGTVNLNNVTATGNTAGLGGVVDVFIGTVNISGGTYSGNIASSGGVIYSSGKSTVTLNGAEFKNNESTDTTVEGKIGGGVVNISSGTLNISGATFDGNKTAYYGGAVNARGTTVTINGNTVIKNNTGKTGAALYFRDSSKVTMENTSIESNTSTSNGVVYNNSGTLTITNITATGNKSYNGLFYISGGTNTITSSTFTSNSATYGGVLYATAKVTLSGCTFESNSATSKGGVIFATGNANVILTDDCLFNTNTAPSGGAIYIDQGGKANVTGGTFNGNTATSGDGGAVMVADSSTDGTYATSLTLNTVTFKNNTASAKGGAISTDTASANLVISANECTFEANKALGGGGGAVEIQNANCASEVDPTEVKIVFVNCIFTKNTCKTTGAAIEIRSNSCAKVDGITATENKATGVGGVVYVTSNFSRFYLTGTVSISGNTASDNSFINLYNSGYTCPPKVYTTHSSSAEWYSLVKGNKSNVQFDMPELP